MKSEVKIFSSIEDLSNSFGEIIKAKMDERGRFNLALSGGNTPRTVFNYLAKKFKNKVDWERINFYWGDERCVPPTSDASNYKMAKNSLLEKVNVIQKKVFRIRGEENPEEEAERYSDLIKKNLPYKNNLPQFDLIMLGLGDDGHTASIFPDQIELIDSERIAAVATHPESRQKRITLTGRIINNAEKIVFIVTGKKKRKIVSEIIGEKEAARNYPANFVNPVNGKLIWLLDEPAASLLQ